MIEVAVDGPLVPEQMEAFAHRLEVLATKREPAVLRVDLTVAGPTCAEALAGTLGQAADSLEGIGSRLVLVGADPQLVDAIGPRGSLAVEPAATVLAGA
jgi:hypothetical protein